MDQTGDEPSTEPLGVKEFDCWLNRTRPNFTPECSLLVGGERENRRLSSMQAKLANSVDLLHSCSI